MSNTKFSPLNIAVGMSGGVDSSVAAYLLKQEGHDVKGLYMHNWEGEDDVCPSEVDFEDVKLVCAKIGIPYWTVNFSAQYLERVFSYFLSEYSKGRTPNPDVLCNREIKFGVFLDFAIKLEAEFVATGHYCRVERGLDGVKLLKALDKSKDQSYFLHQLNQNQLKRAMFPIGGLLKSEVRAIAAREGLATYNKKDSTGICFIGERKFKDFLQNYLPAQRGIIKSEDGKTLGTHDGLMYYTLGQRRGLGIGGRADAAQSRWFVLDKDLKNNILIVSQDERLLLSKSLVCSKVNWIMGEPRAKSFRCFAKFRYRQPDQEVEVKVEGDSAEVVFLVPQRAVTSGQYAVFYDGEECLGGGEIDVVSK